MNDKHGQKPNVLPLVSVVVPVFNAEGWILKTLSQFDAQTYPNIEWILVNDGSEDATSDLLHSWTPHCGHKMVIDKANGGASSARNEGLRKANGDYITFWDCDDSQDSEMLAKLTSAALRGYDLVVCGMYQETNSGKCQEIFTACDEEMNAFEGLRAFLSSKISMSPCLKLISRELLLGNNIAFEEGVINEDLLWTVDVLLNAERIRAVNAPLYHYSSRDGSVSSSLSEKHLVVFDHCEALKDKVASAAPDLLPTCLCYCAQSAWNIIFFIEKNSRTAGCERVVKVARSEYKARRSDIFKYCRGPRNRLKQALYIGHLARFVS